MALIFDTVRTESSHTHGSTNNAKFIGDAWGTKHQTDNGYILLGPANSSHAHIYTDRGSFYLNKGMYVTGGTLLNPSDIRSSIFYDVDNTAYYVNPAGESRFGNGDNHEIRLGPNSSYSKYLYLGGWGTSKGDGAWIRTSNGNLHLEGANPGGGVFLNHYHGAHIYIGNGGGYTNIYNSTRSPIFYDLDNTTYYLNAASGNTADALKVNGRIYRDGFDTTGDGSTNYIIRAQDYSSWIYATGGSYNWGLFWAGNDNAAYKFFSSANPNELAFVGGGSLRASIDLDNGQSYFGTSVRSPQFYDSNNTGYYIHGDGTSRLNILNVNAVGTSVAGIGKVMFPYGAEYNSGSTTGAIKITLPVSWTNTMMTMKIIIYDYSINESFEVHCGGYNHTGGNGYWVNTHAKIIANGDVDRNFNVRFGHDGSKCCITIGETTSPWAYPKVVVTEWVGGHSNETFNNWDNGWDISIVTTLPSQIDQVRSNNQVGRYQSVVYDANNTNYYTDPDSTSNLNAVNANTISISGNSNLGNGNGDVTRVNDILHVGASDSGNASIIFGEDSSNWYGAHLYWDSGYRFSWKTRNAGTDTDLFYYDTNDLSYIHWNRHHHVHNKDINYVNQLHFQDNVRFYDDGNDSYLNFKYGDATTGGIKFLNGSAAQKGFLYANDSGFGLLSADGTWSLRVTDSLVESYHQHRAPIYYDSDNTAYYVDAVGNSELGSLVLNGSTTRGTYTTASQYHSGADNLVLKGNSSGISTIFFESEKDGTNINHASDFGFIQFHPYGTGTSGEANELIIGVSNDADDHVVLNAPNANGLKFRVGSSDTDYTVWHAGNDGSGSGLDADLLDGLQASQFLRSDTNDTFNAGNGAISLRFQVDDGSQIASGGSSQRFPIEIFANNGTDAAIAFHIGGDYAGYFGLDAANNDLYWGGWSVGSSTKHRIWHAGNDGSLIKIGQEIFSSSVSDDTSGPLEFIRGSNNWDDYIIKHNSSKGLFGKQGIGWHNHTNSSFHVFSSGWTANFGVNSDGTSVSRSSSRAPIFYDTNNTAYPLDLASRSYLNALSVSTINFTDVWEGDITINGDANTYYPVGWYGGEQNQVVEIEVYRNYSETAPSTWNTSTHKGGLVCKIRTNFGGWGGSSYDWKLEDFRETYSTMVAWAGHFANSRAFGLNLRGGGAIYHVRIKGRSVGPTVTLGTWDPGGNSTGLAARTSVDSVLLGRKNHIRGNYLYSYNSQVLHSGSTAQTKTGTLQSDVDFRAPLFYDSNDTNYYIDAGSTGTSIKVRGTIENPSIWINDGDNYNNYNENIRLFNPANGVSVIGFACTGTGGVPASSILGYSDRHEVRRGSNWETRTYDGYQVARGSYRAPIFYDSDDTNSYFDKSRLILRSTDPTIIFRDTDHTSAMWHVNSHRMYLLRGNGDTTSWSQVSGQWPVYWDLGNNNAYFGGTVVATNAFTAPIFYDSNNTAYYTNPASTSNMSTVQINGTVRFMNYGLGPTGTYTSTRLQTIFNMDDQYSISADGSSASGAYGLYWSHQNAGGLGGANNLASHGILIIENGSWKGAWGGGSLRTPGDVRAPIFYDYNNTGYYVTPNGNSKINTIGVNMNPNGGYTNAHISVKAGAAYSGIKGLYVEGVSFGAAAEISHPYACTGLTIKNLHTSTGTAIAFTHTGYSYGNVGQITTTTSSTTYSTSSDYRLKENLVPITDGIERVKLLQPKRFNFIVDPDRTVDGFVAHEAQEVVPEAVTGEKDGVDYEGNPEYQGIDQAKLVPLLTAALQEAIAKIEDLESRLQAIENQ